MLKIETGKNNPILRKKLSSVADPKAKELRLLIRAMRKTMHEANGIGLAANQIGKNLRLCIIELPVVKSQKHAPYRTAGSGAESKVPPAPMLRRADKSQNFYALINPEIVKTSKEKVLREEGCLSLPGLWGIVPRFEKVTVKATSPTGKSIKLKATGLLAHALQHELDHLEGVLFVDKAKEVIKIDKLERQAKISSRNEKAKIDEH